VATDEITFATRWREAAQLPSGVMQRARRLARDTVISCRALAARANLGRPGEDRSLRCLFCHYVFDDQRRAFERILLRLQEIGRFVSTDACVDMLNGERPIDGRYFHLSFDDGFRNNLTNAAPSLIEHGIPAAFFVPTAAIGSTRVEAAAFCARINYPAPVELMSWDDVAALHRQGFDIGSHTRTHARFSDISADPDRLEEEIAGSKLEIEARLGTECKYISWPFGKRSDADSASLSAARTAGYRACFGAYRGTVRPGATDRFSVPRHHFEAEWPLLHVEYFARGNMESAEPEPQPERHVTPQGGSQS
jgi:peptidoglycan/xylan/chitin deacetylase (PgdA/CDA1 family)